MKYTITRFMHYLYRQKQAFVLFTSEGVYCMQASAFCCQIRYRRLFFFPAPSGRSFSWYEDSHCVRDLIPDFIRCYQLEGERITLIIDGPSLFLKQIKLPIHNKKDALQSIQWDIAQYVKNGDYCQLAIEPICHNGIITVWLLMAYGREIIQCLAAIFRKEQAVLSYIDIVPTVIGRILNSIVSRHYILVINGNLLYAFILVDGVPNDYCKLDYSQTSKDGQDSFWNSVRKLLQQPQDEECEGVHCMLIWPLVGAVPRIPMDICCRRIERKDLKDHCQKLANLYGTPAEWLLAAIVAEDILG